MRRLILCAGWLLSCGDTPGEEVEPIDERDCPKLSGEDCAKQRECSVISGRRLVPGAFCLSESFAYGCRAASQACDDVVTWANDRTQSALFPSRCLPPGFSATQQHASSQFLSCLPGEGVVCEELSLAACKADFRCRVISGQPVDRAQRCLGDGVELGCTSGNWGCDTALTIGTDPQGGAWSFPGAGEGCVPDGYTTSAGDEVLSWSRCEGDKAFGLRGTVL